MSIETSKRPEHLPDFSHPPLNEVLVGVQFAPPIGYQQIYSGDVWNLFRKEYPKVTEQPPLEPAFETFGLPSTSSIGQFKFLTGAIYSRFWFLSEDESELIQFQQDRFLHNWRESVDSPSVYPRFETMISKFKNELSNLQNYMLGISSQPLSINQCEVSYVNHIIISDASERSPHKWLHFYNLKGEVPEDINFSFREVIHNDDGKPRGRLIVEAITGMNVKNQKIIRLTLTVRGAPKENTIDAALELLSDGRNIIVTKFAELTTDYAHKKWGRIK